MSRASQDTSAALAVLLAASVLAPLPAPAAPPGGSGGFAAPSEIVQRVVGGLAEDGRVMRGWLGIQATHMTPDLAEKLGFLDPQGAVIEKILAGSPAEAAGLKEGDIILKFNGTCIADMRDLPAAVTNASTRSRATVTVLRGGRQLTLDVMLGRRWFEDL